MFCYWWREVYQEAFETVRSNLDTNWFLQKKKISSIQTNGMTLNKPKPSNMTFQYLTTGFQTRTYIGIQYYQLNSNDSNRVCPFSSAFPTSNSPNQNALSRQIIKDCETTYFFFIQSVFWIPSFLSICQVKKNLTMIKLSR